MSYILVAWEQPIPRSMDEVAPLVRSLRADKAMASSPKVDAFMTRLWEKFPSDLDGEDEDYVWDDSFPWEPQPRPRLIYLSISFGHVEEVVPVVLRAARENGLVVYDSEAGTAFLPTGLFLGNPPQPPKPVAPKGFEVKAARNELIDLLSAAFGPLGFKWTKIQAWDTRFVRKYPGGWQSIEPKIDLEDDLQLIKVDFLLSAFLEAADPLLGVEPGSKKAADAFVATTYLSSFIAKTGCERLDDFERKGDAFVLRSPEDVRRFAKSAGDLIEQVLLPRLDNYRSMSDYGRHVLDRVSRNEPAVMSEPTIVRLAAVATVAPEGFDKALARELAAYDSRISELEAMTPPRPAQVAAERAVRARIAAFGDKYRQQLG